MTIITFNHSIHVDVCPDCGEPSVRHMLDPVGYCTHSRELYVPVEYIEVGPVRDLVTALENLLDWAEHIEGEGRMRRTEALEQAHIALEGIGERS